MTREEAADILHNAELPDKWLHNGNYSDVLEAFNYAIDYLRGPQWVRTDKRSPRAEMPSKISHVLALMRFPSGGLCECAAMAVDIDEEPGKYPYWMPLPPLPEDKSDAKPD